jgi:hypothetical protein
MGSKFCINTQSTNAELAKDKPVHKIVNFFNRQITLQKYIKFSIEYINRVSVVIKNPEFRNRLEQNNKFVKETEQLLDNQHNTGEDIGTKSHLTVGVGPLMGGGGNRSDGLMKRTQLPTNIPGLTGQVFDKDKNERLFIIKSLLSEYEINYESSIKDNELALLQKLKEGLRTITDFIVMSISQLNPETLLSLKTLGT